MSCTTEQFLPREILPDYQLYYKAKHLILQSTNNPNPPATSSVVSDSDSQGNPSSKKRKHSRAEKRPNPFGISGGVYFDERDGKFVPHVIMPRILKTDVRRTYAQMFANVYNSCDKEMIDKYLKTFYREDLLYRQRFAEPLINVNKTNCELQDLRTICEFWYSKTMPCPDVHFELRQTQVKARSDGTGSVIFNFRLSGIFIMPNNRAMYSAYTNIDHSVFQDALHSNDDNEKRLLQGIMEDGDHSGLFNITHNGWFHRDEEVKWRQDVVNSANLLMEIDPRFQFRWLEQYKPNDAVISIPYDFLGTITQHLDANNAIYHLTFEGYQ